jgi:hypothetical protein
MVAHERHVVEDGADGDDDLLRRAPIKLLKT